MTVGPLVRQEVLALARQRLTWIVLGALLCAMLIGSAVGSSRVAAESRTLAGVAAETERSLTNAKRTAHLYSRSASYEVAQFRDPTDAFGYMNNFLTAFAVRHARPLSALASGQSDLQPAYVRVNFANPFPDSAYELKSPRMLSLGAFDMGFVLVYLLPLVVIALDGTRLAMEQDTGILRMIASQPIKPGQVAAAKFAALAIILVPVATIGSLGTLGVAGGIAPQVSVFELASLGLLISLYTCFWISLCALGVSLWKGAVGSLTLLLLIWAILTVLLPSIAALSLDLVLPAPSRLAYVDNSRQAMDRIAADETNVKTWLAQRTANASGKAAFLKSAEVSRMAGQNALRQALEPLRNAVAAHTGELERASTAIAFVSPALNMDEALQRLAGTDAARQRRFQQQADNYTQTLRKWFEPQVLANIGRPRPCATCPGRLNFFGFDAVPAFRAPVSGVLDSFVILTLLYLLAVTTAVALIAARRFHSWPM